MNLVELKSVGTEPNVPRTTLTVDFSNVADPQIRALLVAERDGRVYRGGDTDQFSISVLKAAGRRGLLKLTPKPGSRKYDWWYGELTNAGRSTLKNLVK